MGAESFRPQDPKYIEHNLQREGKVQALGGHVPSSLQTPQFMKDHSQEKPEQGLLKSGTQGKFLFALCVILVLGMLDESTEEPNTTDLKCTLNTV